MCDGDAQGEGWAVFPTDSQHRQSPHSPCLTPPCPLPYLPHQVTPRRLYQAVVLWRKAALAWLSTLAHPPSFEYPRLAQLIGGHMGRWVREREGGERERERAGVRERERESMREPVRGCVGLLAPMSVFGPSRFHVLTCPLLPPRHRHTAPLTRTATHPGPAPASASADGPSSIVCCSALDAVAAAARWLTSVPGVPLSRLQALCLLTCNGCSDPWLEVPPRDAYPGPITSLCFPAHSHVCRWS